MRTREEKQDKDKARVKTYKREVGTGAKAKINLKLKETPDLKSLLQDQERRKAKKNNRST